MGIITEREKQKYFAYLGGVIDGLNESRNDINSILDKIRDEIDAESAKSFKSSNWERAKALEWVLEIIDKYRGGEDEINN